MKTPTVKRLVCLANSRKTGGYCVAGKEILENGQIGRWIRPVSNREKEEVSWIEQRYEDGNTPQLLDVIDVPVLSYRPKDYQRENWLLDPQYRWKKVRSISASELLQLPDSVGPLWVNGYSASNGQNDQVPRSLVTHVDNSLRLIKVDELEISVYDDFRRQVRGSFSHCGEDYTFSVTDPVYWREYRQRPDGNYSIGGCFLTVSLGDMWGEFAYKLIAAIIKP